MDLHEVQVLVHISWAGRCRVVRIDILASACLRTLRHQGISRSGQNSALNLPEWPWCLCVPRRYTLELTSNLDIVLISLCLCTSPACFRLLDGRCFYARDPALYSWRTTIYHSCLGRRRFRGNLRAYRVRSIAARDPNSLYFDATLGCPNSERNLVFILLLEIVTGRW